MILSSELSNDTISFSSFVCPKSPKLPLYVEKSYQDDQNAFFLTTNKILYFDNSGEDKHIIWKIIDRYILSFGEVSFKIFFLCMLLDIMVLLVSASFHIIDTLLYRNFKMLQTTKTSYFKNIAKNNCERESWESPQSRSKLGQRYTVEDLKEVS